MDEYLSEKEQWERLKAWLRENVPWIIGSIAVTALAIWGWRQWQAHRDAAAIDASVKYEAVLDAFDKGDRTRALTLIGELGRDHPDSPYNDQAQLAETKIYVQNGQLDKAAENLKTVMGRTRDAELALTARLRLARVQLALGKSADALATLDAAKEPGEFAARYDEARGDIHYAQGDKSGALALYRKAQSGSSNSTVDAQLLGLKIDELSDKAAKPEK